VLQITAKPGIVLTAVSVRRKRTVARLVKERIAARTCLCGCGQAMFRRGLSVRCYNRFLKANHRMPDEQQAEHDAHWVREGKLLHRWESKEQNPFFL
jgi:hypothetical protein